MDPVSDLNAFNLIITIHLRLKFPVYKISLAKQSLHLKMVFHLPFLSSLSHASPSLSDAHFTFSLWEMATVTVHLAGRHILGQSVQKLVVCLVKFVELFEKLHFLKRLFHSRSLLFCSAS